MRTFGFIVLRHVCDAKTDQYWKLACERIRKYHPEDPILIVDDNSNPEFLDTAHESSIGNLTVVQSEYPARGELLPYYYFLKHRPFDIACILHDSVFLNCAIPVRPDTYQILWGFVHNYNNPDEEKAMIRHLKNHEELLEFYDRNQDWTGCFGGMSIVDYEYLASLDARYDISRLLPLVYTRDRRIRFERVIACLLQIRGSRPPWLGDIERYAPYGIPFEDAHTTAHLPLTKVWTGR